MTNPTRTEICCDKTCPNYNIPQIIELTDAEVAQMEADQIAYEAQRAEQEAQQAAKDALKASAKAKLVAGEPLTPEEADTLVL